MTMLPPDSLTVFRNQVAAAAKTVIDQIQPDYAEADALVAQADELAGKGHDKAAEAVRKTADAVRHGEDMRVRRVRADALREILPLCKEAFWVVGLPRRAAAAE